MRCRKPLLLVASMAVLALPAFSSPSYAQDPRRILGPLTAPLGMMLRTLPRPHYRSHRHRKPRAAHRRAPRQREAPAIERARPEPRRPVAPAMAAAATVPFWPIAAPDAFEDMLGYALWPREYGRQFWSHGPRDIMLAMTAPAAAFASGEEDRAQKRLPSIVSAANAKEDERAICIARVTQSAMRPLDRLADAINLQPEQQQNLDNLRATARSAIEAEAAACRSDIPATQPERLRAMIDGLWAMRYAEFRIRPALRAFYDSLNEDQKAQLADEPQTVGSTASVPADAHDPAAVCREAISPGGNPFQRVERALRPTAEQRKSLQMLYGASMEMANFLASTCPAETPETPVARLDAAGDRVMALLHAAMNIEPMLGNFYAQLNDQQRQRFNTVVQ